MRSNASPTAATGPRMTTDAPGDGAPALPPKTAHVIVVRGTIRGPAPGDGFDADTVVYERGDELPLSYAQRAFAGWQGRLAALDEDGDHTAGGEGASTGPMVLTPDANDRLQRSSDVETAIEHWKQHRDEGDSTEAR